MKHRYLLLSFSISLLVCLAACTTLTVPNNDPEQIQARASEIADFDLPAGYHADFSTELMGYTVVAYSRGVDASHIYLIQSKKEVDGEIIDDVLDKLIFDSGDPHTEIGVIETRPIQMRGLETNLIISDLVTSEGFAFRQAVVPFQGKGGPAMLVFSEPIESWNKAIVDTFLASIR